MNSQQSHNTNQPGQRPPRGPRKPFNQSQQNNGNHQQVSPKAPAMKTNRGEALRAGRRNLETATKLMEIHNVQEVSPEKRANYVPISDEKTLRVTFLGGQDGIGEKNMQVVEYGNDAIIVDCGIDLSIDLPGINFGIPDASYLESIKHKIRGYVVTHGHLDHIGALPYIVPKYPAPIYGTHYTIGVVQRIFSDGERGAADFPLKTIEMNMDEHERLQIGPFMVELIRVTHSIPDGAAVAIDTPAGRIINSGDFRLDPEPLDHKPTDVERFQELGRQGVDLLLSESTYAQTEGRVPTESTLVDSIHGIIKNAHGRIFFACFSSNINRIQMVIDAATAAGRQVAIDGRSMLAYVELAVKFGRIRIPKGTLAAMRQMPNLPDNKVLVICTGGQGEMNASLQRMSIGEHKHIKLKASDTVVVSSTPIPGNEIRYEQIGDDLTRLGAKLFRARSYEVDGCGPLHVSGHARRAELLDFAKMIHPKHFVPIYSGPLHRKYHIENLVTNQALPAADCYMVENGESIEIKDGKVRPGPKAPVGTILIDETGGIVPSVVVKDRIVMSEDGIVTVILTIERGSGRLMTSPDIIARGFIYIRDNEELMNGLRTELRRAVQQRFTRIDLDRFKAELKDHITHYLFEHTQRTPIVIPVVNAIAPGGNPNRKPREMIGDSSQG
jgi:ribonuclease J